MQDGSRFDVWTSGIIIVAYAVPGFLFGILLIVLFAGGSFFDWFPLRGLVSDNFWSLPWYAKIGDYFWHLTLPLISLSLAAFATSTLLTKNSFIDEIQKQYVVTARAKGLSERRVLYGHVFRNAMLIIIAGFPAPSSRSFFSGSLLIETIFSLDGLGRLGFESVVKRDYPGGLRDALHLLADGARRRPRLRPHLYLGRSAHRLREAGRLTWTARSRTGSIRNSPATPGRRAAGSRRPTSGAGRNFKSNRRGYWSFWIFLILFVLSLFAEFIANDRPILVDYKGELLTPVFVDYPESKFGGFLARTDYRDPFIQKEIERSRLDDLAADPLFLPDRQFLHPAFRADRALVADVEEGALLGLSGGRPAIRTASSATWTGSARTTRRATCWRG